jgi:hypothetical protein
MTSSSERFARAVALIDAANAADPNQEHNDDGQLQAKELLYGQRMSAMLERYAAEADEAGRLAVRAQHVQRWKIPRSDFPMDRAGYHRWRTSLYRFHAELAAGLTLQAGYDAALAARVAAAVGKKALRSNPDSQLVEDVAGLVFIEHYMAPFAAQKADYSEDKWLDIIAKTWQKLSPRAHEFVLGGGIRLPEHLVPLILKAVGAAH